MEIRDYIVIWRRYWQTILATVLAGIAVSATVALVQPSTYQATASAYVATPSSSSIAELSQGASFTQQAVKSYAQVATSSFVLSPVIKRLHLQLSTSQLAAEITATAPVDTVIIDITVADRSATRAAAVANAVTEQLSNSINSLTSVAATPVKITRIQPAVPPVSRSNLPLALLMTLGALAGLIVGYGLSVLRESLDTRVHSRADLEEVTDTPIVGELLLTKRDQPARLVMRDDELGAAAEAYRALRANLNYVSIDKRVRTTLITSSIAGEGKSTTAANLAIALTQAETRVLLIDADLRRPAIADYFALEGELGLTDVLVGQVQREHAIQRSAYLNLDILTSGQTPPNPGELLGSRALHKLLEELRPEYDQILIDSPPLLPVADAAVLAGQVDGVIIVAAADRTTRTQLDLSLTTLATTDSALLGIALNMVPPGRATAGVYGYAHNR
ncbi:polysaccharide biosynthesis tyrosine autokinase [Amnibacterium sp. CER49]|uniref:polysaccharide biosynthesis tyrosine autokinase n=1 Tax=Amnibacterium sp. CER49 TaxID=3039161 RepID=UPI0024472AFE|nr:polysaccharide biosynthesis tyrosine autokinase [Amnibacterium sp. CER49]MDH2442999.1 polysaccharide biosynthesis tyrosine autokinase [Amnibacterium sp. CER49]